MEELKRAVALQQHRSAETQRVLVEGQQGAWQPQQMWTPKLLHLFLGRTGSAKQIRVLLQLRSEAHRDWREVHLELQQQLAKLEDQQQDLLQILQETSVSSYRYHQSDEGSGGLEA
ncbi:unnamed protein product [Caretta caretta]